MVNEVSPDKAKPSASGGRKAPSAEQVYSIAELLPILLVGCLVWFLLKFVHFGLLPGAYIKKDPLFANIFIVNLGSMNLDAGYHHLYEYGNISIWMMAGYSKEEVVVGRNGNPEIRPMMTLRYSFGERIEDGLDGARALEIMKRIIEDPGESTLMTGQPLFDEM